MAGKEQKEMAGVTTITHFTHPDHQLSHLRLAAAFTCGACKTRGSGPRYRCTHPGCDFELHGVCAACPDRHRFFVHPDHDLVLRGAPRTLPCFCDVCGQEIRGIFYTCCAVNVHPRCTRVKTRITAPAHPQHDMDFVRSGSGTCARCRAECGEWRYRCEPCGVDLHPKCLKAAAGSSSHGSWKNVAAGMAGTALVTTLKIGVKQYMRGHENNEAEAQQLGGEVAEVQGEGADLALDSCGDDDVFDFLVANDSSGGGSDDLFPFSTEGGSVDDGIPFSAGDSGGGDFDVLGSAVDFIASLF